MTRWRSTIRTRLTLHYAGGLFLAGLALIGVMYIYFDQLLDDHAARRASVTEQLTAEFLGQVGAHDAAEVETLHTRLREQFAQDRVDTMRGMLTWSVASVGIVAIAAGGLGWLLAGRALRPLQQITATARRVADRSLHERIALEGPDDEIKDLAVTFDAMLERLDRSFDGQRRFVANASHELRTPLTINRTLIQVALDSPSTPTATRELGIELLEVNHRHERLIDGLLVLATSDQNLTERQPVAFGVVVQQAAATFATRAANAGVSLRISVAPARVDGDSVLLERLVQNLLDNAIRYNLSSSGWVSVATTSYDGQVELLVENTGPVVAADQLGELFEPFHRLPSADRLADGGAGLGLSIVRSVAHAHGGSVEASVRDGGGLRVVVRIPSSGTG